MNITSPSNAVPCLRDQSRSPKTDWEDGVELSALSPSCLSRRQSSRAVPGVASLINPRNGSLRGFRKTTLKDPTDVSRSLTKLEATCWARRVSLANAA